MKIATWNLERLIKKKNKGLCDKLNGINADILILTETNAIINPGNEYSFVSTQNLPQHYDGVNYKAGENRTTIWTKYPIRRTYNTFDPYTSICADIETPFGMLTVYATIIGVFGGRGERFKSDLLGQLKDFENIFPGKNVCLAGDFNVSFSGYVYPGYEARQTLKKALDQFSLSNLTASINDNIDHIVLSYDFLKDRTTTIESWNIDKTLSDHIGICVIID